nr:uncharacterized protein LOC110356571 isoform X1 [Columba livia]
MRVVKAKAVPLLESRASGHDHHKRGCCSLALMETLGLRRPPTRAKGCSMRPMARKSRAAAMCDEERKICTHEGGWQRATTNMNLTANRLSKELPAETPGDSDVEMWDVAPCDYEETWAWTPPAEPQLPQPLMHPTEPMDAPQCPRLAHQQEKFSSWEKYKHQDKRSQCGPCKLSLTCTQGSDISQVINSFFVIIEQPFSCLNVHAGDNECMDVHQLSAWVSTVGY